MVLFIFVAAHHKMTSPKEWWHQNSGSIFCIDIMDPCGLQGRLSTPLQQYALYASGYRPTTSEIAAQIDGFNDDFELPGVNPSGLEVISTKIGDTNLSP
jgi:hypothetical protein